MHYANGINRPPYEANDAILQVTSGCSHNKCEFCTYYRDCGFSVSPIEEVKEDLEELRDSGIKYERAFLQGGDAFVLSYEKLMEIAILIHEYLPSVQSIGSYARITSMNNKTGTPLYAKMQKGEFVEANKAVQYEKSNYDQWKS
ncbi:hypothetical protein [Anaerosporobacter sp.]